MARIAFYTFAILREPQGHPQVQGFFDSQRPTVKVAENSEGFIDRDRPIEGNQRSWGPLIYPRFYDPQQHKDLYAPATLSLWTDVESVYAYAYHGAHGDAFRKRREWCLTPAWPTYVAWWVDTHHIPTRGEANQRLEYLYDHGSTAYAFDFKQPFDAEGRPTSLDRQLIQQRLKSNIGPL